MDDKLAADALATIERLKAQNAKLREQLVKARGGKSASIADAIGTVISEGVVSGNPAPGFDTSQLFKDRTHFDKARELEAARTAEQRQAIVLKYRDNKS